MFCEKCGAQLPDANVKFCASCGAPVNAAPVADAPVKDVPADTNSAAEAPAAAPVVEKEAPVTETVPENAVADAPAEAVPAQPAPVEKASPEAPVPAAEIPAVEVPAETPAAVQPVPVDAPKKKFNPLKVIIPVVAVVVALSIAFVAFGSQIVNTVKKLVMSPTDYYADVEYSSIVNMFGTADKKNFDYNNPSVKSNTTLEISDYAKELLSKFGINLDDYIEGGKISIDYNVDSSADALKAAMALSLNDTELVGGELIYDLANWAVYGKVPLISEDSLFIDMSEMFAQSDYDPEQLSLVLTVVSDILEDEKLMDKLEDTAKEYLKFMLKNSFEFEKETDKVKVDGVTQSLTKLSADISEEDMAKMLIAVLEKLNDDEAAKKLIIEELFYNKIVEPLKDKVVGLEDADLEEGYDEFDKGIEKAIDALKDMDDDDEVATYTVWVDSKGNIVGRELNIIDEATVRYLTVNAGGKCAFELVAEGYDGEKLFSFEGSAKQSFGVLKNGVYTLSAEGQDIITVELEKLDLTKAEKGEIDAKLRIKLVDEVFGELMSEAGDLFGIISSPAIDAELVSDGKSSSMKLAIMMGDKLVLTLTNTMSVSEGETVQVPSDYVDAEEYAAKLQDAEAIEAIFDKLLEKLEQAGVKPDVIDMLEQSLQVGLNPPEYENNYDNDYDYDYDYDSNYDYDYDLG